MIREMKLLSEPMKENKQNRELREKKKRQAQDLEQLANLEKDLNDHLDRYLSGNHL